MTKWTDRARDDLARGQGWDVTGRLTSRSTVSTPPGDTPTGAQPVKSTLLGGWTDRARADLRRSSMETESGGKTEPWYRPAVAWAQPSRLLAKQSQRTFPQAVSQSDLGGDVGSQERIDQWYNQITSLEAEKANVHTKKMQAQREKVFNRRTLGLGGSHAGMQAAQEKMDAADQRYFAIDREIQDIEKKIAEERAKGQGPRTVAEIQYDLDQQKKIMSPKSSINVDTVDDDVQIFSLKDILRKKELEDELRKAQPSFAERVIDTVFGGLKKYAADMTNTIGTLRELGQGSRDKQNQALLEDYAQSLKYAQIQLDAVLEDAAKNPEAWTEGEIQSYYNVRDMAQLQYDAVAKVYGKENQDRTIQGVYEVADKLQSSSSEDIKQAKEGLGMVGQMAVDAGNSVTQMAGDAIGRVLTGSGLIPLAMRAFGGGAQKARQDGGDLRGQAAYGLSSAAIEAVTEKMFGMALPFSKVYGGGSFDDVVEQTIRKTVEKLASTQLGQEALQWVMTVGASASTEGLEDLIGNWLEWQTPRLYGGDVASAQETLENSLYDFCVAGMAGLFGSVAFGGRHADGERGKAVTQEQAGTDALAETQGTTGQYNAERPVNVDKPTVPIIQISLEELAVLNGGKLPEQGGYIRDTIINRAKKRLGLDQNEAAYIPASNISRGGEEYVLKVTKSTLHKMFSPADGGAVPLEAAAVVEHLEQIANNAVWYHGEGDNRKRIQIRGVDHLLTTVYIDGTPTVIDITVRITQQTPQTEAYNVLYYVEPEAIRVIE